MKRGKPLRRTGAGKHRTPLTKIQADIQAGQVHDQAPTGTASRRRNAGRRRDDSQWRGDCLELRGEWCRACKTSQDLQCDHMIPRAQGGGSVVENGLVLCRGCHERKTKHLLLINRDWLGVDQIKWLAVEGHAAWLPDGTVGGRHCPLFAELTTRRNTE